MMDSDSAESMKGIYKSHTVSNGCRLESAIDTDFQIGR